MPRRALTFLLVAIVSFLPLVTATASKASPIAPVPSSVFAPGPMDLENVSVALSASVAVPDAIALAATLDEAVKGFRYENAGLIGEFFPSASKPVEEFASEFSQKYSTEPQIVAIIVERAVDPESGKAEPGLDALVVDTLPFIAEAPSESSLNGAIEESLSNENNDGTTDGSAGAPDRRDGAESTDWVPELAQVKINRVDDRVFIQQFLNWGSHVPTSVPEHYGMEVELNTYNDEMPDLLRPSCLGDHLFDYSKQFFADSHNTNWSLSVLGGGDEVEPYSDTDNLDSCQKNSFAIGIRYPQKIPAAPNGDHVALIEIDAEAGAVPETRIEGVLQLVDDYACEIPYISLADCMGDTLTEPVGVKGNARILSGDRRWMAPDRCWIAEDFLTLATPIQSCGQPQSLEGIDVGSLSMAGDTNAMNISLTHNTCEPIPAGVEYVPGSPSRSNYASRLPYVYDPARADATSEVGDIRAWIGDEEVAISGVGWEWRSSQSGDYFRLQNNNDSVQIGRGLPSTADAFAENGTISFRVADGPVNYFKVQGLGDATAARGASAPGGFLLSGFQPSWPYSTYQAAGSHLKDLCASVSGIEGSEYSGVQLGDTYYFPSQDSFTSERGLSAFDGEAVTTIATGLGDISGLVISGSALYFVGSERFWDPTTNTSSTSNSIYKFDGAQVQKVLGTEAVVPSVPFPWENRGVEGQTTLAVLDDYIYFIGTDPENGFQLWRLSTTTQSSSMVVSSVPLPPSQYGMPYGLVATDDCVYFSAPTTARESDGRPDAYTLWAYDGSGILAPTNIPSFTNSTLGAMTLMGGDLYVAAAVDEDSWSEKKLWTLDGVTASLVKSTVDSGIAVSTGLVSTDSAVYFLAAYPHRLWKYNGDNTVPASQVLPQGKSVLLEGSFGDKLMLTGYEPATGREPWVLNGYALAPLADLVPGDGSSYPDWVGSDGRTGYFNAQGSLWSTDGEKTTNMSTIRYSYGIGQAAPWLDDKSVLTSP
jgi:hypothetical protein